MVKPWKNNFIKIDSKLQAVESIGAPNLATSHALPGIPLGDEEGAIVTRRPGDV